MSPIVETSAGWATGMVILTGTGAIAASIGAAASWLGAVLGLG